MISTQSLVKHLLIGPSAPLIELSFQHCFNFCSSCPLIISHMRGCRREQQSLTAVLLLPSAHSASTSSPQLMKSPLRSLPDPPFRFLLEPSPAREASHVVAQTRCLFHGLHLQWASFCACWDVFFSLAWLTQIKTLAKIWEFNVSHGLAFLSSFSRLELELIISVCY